jgi:hypothetical protein
MHIDTTLEETCDDDITYAETTNALTDLLKTYCETHKLPHESADMLLLEVFDRIYDLRVHAEWLQRFITQWETVQAEEDAQYAECKRNGHRDTGRGVCADCGLFI